jgi:hypothetical protein
MACMGRKPGSRPNGRETEYKMRGDHPLCAKKKELSPASSLLSFISAFVVYRRVDRLSNREDTTVLRVGKQETLGAKKKE